MANARLRRMITNEQIARREIRQARAELLHDRQCKINMREGGTRGCDPRILGDDIQSRPGAPRDTGCETPDRATNWSRATGRQGTPDSAKKKVPVHAPASLAPFSW